MKAYLLLTQILLYYQLITVSASTPNIILIVTDDLDIVLNGLTPLVYTQQLVANEGATFTNAFTTSPICCPSRASILSGQYAHNHRTLKNSVSGGCYGQHWLDKVEAEAFPAQLQRNGYRTFYAGKYLNEYNGEKVPPGWTQWFGLLGNSKYRNFVLNENGKRLKYGDNAYLTDVIKRQTIQFLNSTTEPFMAIVAPPAPHAPFDPAARHSGMFKNVTALRTPNFNTPSGELDKHWLLTMEPPTLPPEVIETIDFIYHKRWETLASVDELVRDIIQSLITRNILNNTYVVFTSDNGYHMGQFAQAYDKRQPYETDIRVPLLVRGPGIRSKTLVHQPVALLDLAPTFLSWAGIASNTSMDGQSFTGVFGNEGITERQILIEYWGEGNERTYSPECPWSEHDRLNQCTKDAACHCQDAWNNTYSCVRHLATDLNFVYCEFKDDVQFVEAYSLSGDQYQINNIATDMLPSVRAHYSIAVQHLNDCAGDSCRKIF